MKKLLNLNFLISLLILFNVQLNLIANESSAKTSLIIDLSTGETLFEKNPNKRIYPSSITKIMTALLAFEKIKNGSLSLDQEILVSEKAWRMGGSKMFIEVNEKVKVKDLLKGIIVQSGNDASVALAEGISGSEETFVMEMNSLARKIGLNGTNFSNSTGWPDDNHYTTAADLAILAKYTIENHYDLYKMYKISEFTYNGIKQDNRNPLLETFKGSDGFKTGYTEGSGYSLVGSAERDGRRLIIVLHGLESSKDRSQESSRLMEWAFNNIQSNNLQSNSLTAKETNFDNLKLNTNPQEYRLVDPQYIQQTLKNHLYACIASDDSYKESGRTAGYSLRNYNQEKIIVNIKGDKILSFKNENIYNLNDIFFSLLNRKECFDLRFANYWAVALTKNNYELELDFTYLFNNQNTFNNAYNASLKKFSGEENLIQNLDSYKSKYVKADVLNVRDDIDGNIIGKIYINDIISIINERANWSLIANTDGLTGWVSSQYLSDNQRVLSVNTNSIKLIDYMCKSDLNNNELCLENFQLSQVSEMKNIFNNHDLIKSMQQTTLSTEEDKYFKYIDLYLNSKHKSNNKVTKIVKNQKKQLEKIVPYFLDQFKEQSYLNLELKGKNCLLDLDEYEDNDYGLFTKCRLDLFKQDDVTTSVRIYNYLYKEDTGNSISFQIEIDDLSEYYLSDGTTSFKENNLQLNHKYEIFNFLQDLISKYSSYNYSAATLDIMECNPSDHENIKNYCETITDENLYYPSIKTSRVVWFIDDYLSLQAWVSNYNITIYIDDVRFDNSHLYEENANYVFSDYLFEKTFSVFDNDKKYYANLASDVKTNKIEKSIEQNLDNLVSENLIDETPPTISCIQSEISKDSKINIKCSISDDSDIYAVILNGKKLSGNLENINEDILLPFGESNIELIALDKYGNKEEFITSVNREFTLDQTIDEVDGLFPGKIKDKSSNNKVAVIIGIQNYDDIPDTKYSDKDAMAFAEFANQTLNIHSKNIKYLFNEDANYFGFKGVQAWLENKVNKSTDVYVFYSGHGLGVEGKSKLLPSNFVTQFQEESSYEKDEFLSDIANLNPNHIYAFFDTCFSGLGRNGETLIAGLKNISIVEETAPVDNITIFNSSSGLEYSTDFDEAGHGLFSYYLMKGLEGNADINSDNEITSKELFSFIKENVSDRALDIGLSQNPSLIGESDNVIVRW